MSTIIVKKTSAKKVFEFAGTNLNAKGEVIYDPSTLVPESISGSFYEKADPETGINGEMVGGFDGYYGDGKLNYTISNMTIENAQEAIQIVAEIDADIENIISAETAE